MSKKSEIVSLRYQSIAVNTMMTIIKKAAQYPAVSPQLGMNVTHIIILVAVKAVIVIITALVRAEFFIRPAKELCSAVKTYSFHIIMF
jgi:hypothetical protein